MMRSALLSISLLGSVLLASGLGQKAAAFEMRSYTTGKELLTVCSGDRDSCYMYVYGVLDIIMLNDDSTKTCSFNSEGVAGDKAVSTVLSYLQSHPDRMDWSAAALVQNAIRSKFPCAKQKSTDKKSPDETIDLTP